MIRYSFKFITLSMILMFNFFNLAFADLDLRSQNNLDPKDRLYVKNEQIYVPSLFTKGNNVELVLTGYLPNLCYQDVNSEFELTPETYKIKIKLWAKLAKEIGLGKNIYCAQLIRPYLHKINLGKINNGIYKIEINPNTESAIEKNLTIEDDQILISL